MKRKVFLVLFSICIVGWVDSVRIVDADPYNREAAVEYAQKYAFERNSNYASLESNCTNFVSQSLVAGGKRMDSPSRPRKDVRITYHNNSQKWYCDYIWTNKNRWKEFSVTTSFVRTDAFVDYWTKERGMKLYQAVNSIGGLLDLYEFCELGDVIILYNTRQEIEHLCIITKITSNNIFLSANTLDFLDRSIVDISSSIYPQIGLLKIE